MADQPEAKNINNIYYDCLERIFDFLDLKSLLNLAQTCKRLQIAAAAKFGDEYGERLVDLHPHAYLDSSDIYVTNSNYNPSVLVCGNIRLPFLRCFGSKISKLVILFTNADQRADRVGQYINEYCADNLTEIYIWGHQAFSNDSFQKPFNAVTKVSIRRCEMKFSLRKCSELFPNMRRLQLGLTNIDQTAVQVHFPHLKHLSLSNDFETVLTTEETAQILHSNKQLESLDLWLLNEMTFSELSNMISEHPSISKLTVNSNVSTMGNPTMAELIRFGNSWQHHINVLGRFIIIELHR